VAGSPRKKRKVSTSIVAGVGSYPQIDESDEEESKAGNDNSDRKHLKEDGGGLGLTSSDEDSSVDGDGDDDE
jgi:hypothetical protein